jgi:hypothetical protein
MGSEAAYQAAVVEAAQSIVEFLRAVQMALEAIREAANIEQ